MKQRLPLMLVVALSAPLVMAFGIAVKDGVERSRTNAPLAMLGPERFEQLSAFHASGGSGEAGFPHYYNPRGGFRSAPDFELRDRNGQAWRLSEHRGKVVVMNFWSSTCPPCIEEMPSLELFRVMLAERFGSEVEFVAVTTDPNWESVEAILPPSPQIRHLFDADRSVIQGMYGTTLFPETWIVDGEGNVRFRYDGAFDWSSPVALDVVGTFL